MRSFSKDLKTSVSTLVENILILME